MNKKVVYNVENIYKKPVKINQNSKINAKYTKKTKKVLVKMVQNVLLCSSQLKKIICD